MFECASEDLHWGCTAVHFSVASISWTHVGGVTGGGSTLFLKQRISLHTNFGIGDR